MIGPVLDWPEPFLSTFAQRATGQGANPVPVAPVLGEAAMPSVQAGQVIRLGGSWGVRYYAEDGKRRRQGGFATKSAARAWLDNKVEEITALRRGDPSAIRRREMPTVGQLVDEYLG